MPVAPLNLPRYSTASIWAATPLEPVHEDGELLADRRGGGGLAVGVREHRRRRGAIARSRSASITVAEPRQPDLADARRGS